MDDDQIVVNMPDPLQTATECLIALSQAIDSTESWTARKHLFKMMESITTFTSPPKGQVLSFPGGKSDAVTH